MLTLSVYLSLSKYNNADKADEGKYFTLISNMVSVHILTVSERILFKPNIPFKPVYTEHLVIGLVYTAYLKTLSKS